MKHTDTKPDQSNDNIFAPLILCVLMVLAIFSIDLQIPLGVAGGVPYVAVILVSLWFHNHKYVIGFAMICSALTLLGFYFSPDGGELWKVIANRGLALFAIWVTAILAIKWNFALQKNSRMISEAEKKQEKQKIYYATMHSAQHITNNLLNQLKLVELEIEKHPDFDQQVRAYFNDMTVEAKALLKDLSSLQVIEAEEIINSVYPKKSQ